MHLPLITHLGAEYQVTGSCHLLRVNGLNIMVDCGLSMGHAPVLPMEKWPAAPSDIHYLFLTHAHIDHVGRLPELILRGFKGEIITTHGTRALILPMLRDAVSFSSLDESKLLALDKTIDDLSWGFEYGQEFDLKNGVKFRLYRAGHILGSCFIRFEENQAGWSVIFSGDLGAKDTPILPDPEIPDKGCDLLVLESTYGDRVHQDRRERVARLGAILKSALADRGKVFIPAFALGRCQELIYEMDRLFSGSDFRTAAEPFPVFIDSPLGLEITRIYAGLSEFWDREARGLLRHGDNPVDFDNLYAVGSYREHIKLIETPGPCVILAGSGMCTGGRIVDHLKAGLFDSENDIFFVGYQAKGTQGRDIIKYSRKPGGYVYLDGEAIPIKARLHILEGYSAHADQAGLVEWVQSMPEKPGQIKLVHGDPNAKKALAAILAGKGYHVQ